MLINIMNFTSVSLSGWIWVEWFLKYRKNDKESQWLYHDCKNFHQYYEFHFRFDVGTFLEVDLKWYVERCT